MIYTCILSVISLTKVWADGSVKSYLKYFLFSINYIITEIQAYFYYRLLLYKNNKGYKE